MGRRSDLDDVREKNLELLRCTSSKRSDCVVLCRVVSCLYAVAQCGFCGEWVFTVDAMYVDSLAVYYENTITHFLITLPGNSRTMITLWGHTV
jgi:hypothetical protein